MLRLVVLATALALVQSAPAVAECATSHFVVDQDAVSQHDEDGTIVPGSVSHGAVDLCDQIAAIGPDGTVRGVSDIIDQVPLPNRTLTNPILTVTLTLTP